MDFNAMYNTPDYFIECKTCKKQVKEKNLKRHMRKIHSALDTSKTKAEQPEPKPSPSRIARRQALFAKINQGLYDTKIELLNLIENAKSSNAPNILKAAQQRLKKRFPATYRRYVGPLELRDPLGSKTCYCAIASSIDSIAHDIMNQTIPNQALLCDACWEIDITYAWGIYGPWGAKTIDTPTWKTICHERGDSKYATG